MITIRSKTLWFALVATVLWGTLLLSQTRRDFVVPDIPGFITLKGDFHMHTTFSDGSVLPAVRVLEAWRDGLDIIAITDHIEFPPPYPDPQPDANRSYDLARPDADRRGVILIRAAEITGSMPPGHFNALFLKDVNALKQADVMGAFREAAAQGAFFTWNHPGWTAQQPEVTRWFPEHTDLYERGWLNGIEVANEKEFYPIARQWAAEKQLTVFANSDAHDPSDFVYASEKAERRFLTLVFAKDRTEEGVREALRDRRTAAYYGETLFGDARSVRPLVLACLKVLTPRVFVSAGHTATVLVTNTSDLPLRLSAIKSDRFSVAQPEPLGPRSTGAFSLSGFAGLQTGEHDLALRFEVANVMVGSGTPLVIDLPFTAFVWNRILLSPDPANQWRIEGAAGAPTIEVRYTLDRSAPAISSAPVSRPFTATGTVWLKLAAFRDGRQIGEGYEDRFDLHGAVAQKVTLARPPDPRYAGDGASSLTDGRRGTERHADGRWLGFQQGDLDAVVEFDRPRTPTSLSVTFLESPRSWIFLPTEVEFFSSADGVRYDRIGRVSYAEAAEGKSRGIVTTAIRPNGAAIRFLKVVAKNTGVCPRWHRSAGQPAWLFVDEIVVR